MSKENKNEENDEIEIKIEPNYERLRKMGITKDEFDDLLPTVIDEYHRAIEGTKDDENVPAFEDVVISYNGQTFALGDVAVIRLNAPPGFENTLCDETSNDP